MRMPFVPPVSPRLCLAVLLLVLTGSVAAPVMAQSADDPPTRAARLSYLAGDVGLLPAGAHDWRPVDVNRPLTDGDQLSSGPGARAELELGGAALRIDGGTDLGVLALNDRTGQFELTRGTLDLSVRHLGNGQSYEVDTPTVALVIDRPGSFRVDIGADGRATRVTAFDGNAEVYGANGDRQDVLAGRSYRFGDASLERIEITDIEGEDAFDAWCQDRDRRYTDSMASRYVPAGMVGAEDLDNYGSWVDEPDYGAVWFPAQVAAGWAPYRFGHWTWVEPWGWTWVDDAPWGFAPFHYGRWAYIRGAWGWLPGTCFGPPVYAPALVAFVGGRHWGVSLGLGGPVGWFPLGPREIFNPWYRASRRYYAQVNRTDFDDHRDHDWRDLDARIARHYDDFRRGHPLAGDAHRPLHPHGFTAVPARHFAAAHDIHRYLLHVDPRRLADATIRPHGPALKPVVDPVRRFDPQLRALPERGLHRPVVMRHTPPHGRFQRVAWQGPLQPRRIIAPAPAVAHAAADRPMAGRPAPRVAATPWHSRELPSARYARPGVPSRDEMRPGVSFISRGPEPARPVGRSAAALPQVPHFERLRTPPATAAPRQQDIARFEALHRTQPAVFRARVTAPHWGGQQPRGPQPIYRPPAFRPPPRVIPEQHAATQVHAQHGHPRPAAAPPRRWDPHRH